VSTAWCLARIGGAIGIGGAVLLVIATLLHPLGSDPADAPAAFAEYAADSFYVWSHLGQFIGFCGIGAGLFGIAATLETGRAAAWGRLGAAGAVISVAVAAVLQAVDGVALKATVGRWSAASGETRAMTFEAALALRQIEIGLAGLLSITGGLTLLTLACGILCSTRYPSWIGALALISSASMAAAGAAQAATGFSSLAMTLSMLATSMFLAWIILIGLRMWRLAVRAGSESDAAVADGRSLRREGVDL
jgi:hypothetical protein